MRVCYLLQTHQNPGQIARLVATLRRGSPEAEIVVAHDTSGCALSSGELAADARLHLRHVVGPIQRGYLSMLRPWIETVGWLREQGLDHDWLVYLSGQDYPVLPLARCESILAAADCDGFVRHWPALAGGGPWPHRRGLVRYGFQYRDQPRWPAALLRLLRAANGIQHRVHVHLVYGPRVGLRARRTPFSADFPCHAGWQWTTLRRRAAECVIDRLHADPGLAAYYQRTICPDESLVQTILVNEPGIRLIDDNLRYADTSTCRDGRPRLLGVADLPLLTSGAYHFARKFDPAHDARVLDLLDQQFVAAA